MDDITVRWDANGRLLVARLSGAVTAADALRWAEEVQAALAQIPDGATFKLLSDLFGYEPVGLEAHKAMRGVIPLALAAHGFRTGLIAMVGAPEPTITTTRGVRCVAVAHVHHDANKMALYEERVGRADERFFSSRDAARAWIESPVPEAMRT
jgi:hypothetical protein